MTAALVAALLTIVLPAAALAQDHEPAPAGEQRVEFRSGDRLLSQKPQYVGLLEKVGCSNDDFWAVYNHPDNKGKIGITCGGFDSFREIGAASGEGPYHYNATVSCRAPVVEVRPNTVLTIPTCRNKLNGQIGELQNKNEELKGKVAGAEGRAEAESKRADDNKNAQQASESRAQEALSALKDFAKKVTFLGYVGFAFVACALLALVLVLRRIFRKLDLIAVNRTSDHKAVAEAIARAVEANLASTMDANLKRAAEPILKELTVEQAKLAKGQADLEKREANMKAVGDEVGAKTGKLRKDEQLLAADRAALARDREDFDRRKNELFSLATSNGFEEGQRVWEREAATQAAERAEFEKEKAAARSKWADREQRLASRESVVDAREADIAAREAELKAKADATKAAEIELSPSGPNTAPFPLAEASLTPGSVASPNGRPVSQPTAGGSVVRATMSLGLKGNDPPPPPAMPRPSKPPSFGPEADDEETMVGELPAREPQGPSVTDKFEIVEPSFRMGDDGRFVCNHCDAEVDTTTTDEHNHFICVECRDAEVMDLAGLTRHVTERHPELVNNHGSDRPATTDGEKPTSAPHRVLEQDFESFTDSDMLKCRTCLEYVNPDRTPEHVHVECLRCSPPMMLMLSDLAAHNRVAHSGEGSQDDESQAQENEDSGGG